ncbi:MAG: hypothetical protein R8L07_10495 [Alphaproteobacteria bacterium]|nr:hypothetical protein [Alphaproteobacteria bacterium]
MTVLSNRFTALALIGFLSACATYETQTTSGRTYLEEYPGGPTPLSDRFTKDADGNDVLRPLSVDEEVALAANVEPQLRFPARIGLAYIQNGQLSPVPAGHGAAWLGAAKSLGPEFGQFVPVSPLVAGVADSNPREASSLKGRSRLAEAMRSIRLASARQHLDAVLVYESFGQSKNSATPLSALNVTLIGMALVPANLIEGQGFAQAILLDVRNGYTYGNAVAVGDSASLSTYSNTGSAEKTRAEAAAADAVETLTEQVADMMRRLRSELADVAKVDPS